MTYRGNLPEPPGTSRGISRNLPGNLPGTALGIPGTPREEPQYLHRIHREHPGGTGVEPLQINVAYMPLWSLAQKVTLARGWATGTVGSRRSEPPGPDTRPPEDLPVEPPVLYRAGDGFPGGTSRSLPESPGVTRSLPAPPGPDTVPFEASPRVARPLPGGGCVPGGDCRRSSRQPAGSRGVRGVSRQLPGAGWDSRGNLPGGLRRAP